MSEPVVVAPTAAPEDAARMMQMLLPCLPEDAQWVRTAEDLGAAAGKRLLFAIALDESGMNSELDRMKHRLAMDRTLLEGAKAAILVDGRGELFTKSVAREMVFRANLSGCGFIPKPLIEATGSLANFDVRARLLDCSWEEAYSHHLQLLVQRLLHEAPRPMHTPARLLVVYSSDRVKRANSLRYWQMIRRHLGPEIEVIEANLGKGQIYDCKGCSWQACTSRGCPKPDLMRDELFQRIDHCDALLLITPNLNDSVGSDMAAFINRLTHLSNNGRIRGQLIYAIIVSGYSGGDLLSRQLLNAFCLNKGFCLPPHFATMKTANAPLSIMRLPNIEADAARFATHLQNTLLETGPSSLWTGVAGAYHL